MSALPMQTPTGIPPYLIPGSSGGIIIPPFNPSSVPAPNVPQIPTMGERFMNGIFGAIPAEGQGLFGDPREMRRQQMMAMGAAMLGTPGKLGKQIGAGYLASQKARSEYIEDKQRNEYMQQLTENQRQAAEKSKRDQEMLTKRSTVMGGMQGVTPEALETAAIDLYRQGDVAGAEAAMEMASNIRTRAISERNANTNAAIAERGLHEKPQFIEGPNGIYRTNPDGSVARVASWDQFNPNTGPKNPQDLVPDDQQKIIKDQLGAQLGELIGWAENDGGKLLGSPVAGSIFDSTLGRAFGTEDFQRRREFERIKGKELLEMAKYLKPMSNTDIVFLERSMPLDTDPPEAWAKWLRQFAGKAQINLQQGASVFDKYGLERPGQAGNASGTGSF